MWTQNEQILLSWSWLGLGGLTGNTAHRTKWTDDKRKETQIRRIDSRKCEKMSPDDKTFCLKSAGVRQRRRAGRFPDRHQAPAASPSRLTTHTWWAVQDTHTYMPILPLVDCHTTPTKCGLVFWLKKQNKGKLLLMSFNIILLQMHVLIFDFIMMIFAVELSVTFT